MACLDREKKRKGERECLGWHDSRRGLIHCSLSLPLLACQQSHISAFNMTPWKCLLHNNNQAFGSSEKEKKRADLSTLEKERRAKNRCRANVFTTWFHN